MFPIFVKSLVFKGVILENFVIFCILPLDIVHSGCCNHEQKPECFNNFLERVMTGAGIKRSGGIEPHFFLAGVFPESAPSSSPFFFFFFLSTTR